MQLNRQFSNTNFLNKKIINFLFSTGNLTISRDSSKHNHCRGLNLFSMIFKCGLCNFFIKNFRKRKPIQRSIIHKNPILFIQHPQNWPSLPQNQPIIFSMMSETVFELYYWIVCYWTFIVYLTFPTSTNPFNLRSLKKCSISKFLSLFCYKL